MMAGLQGNHQIITFSRKFFVSESRLFKHRRLFPSNGRLFKKVRSLSERNSSSGGGGGSVLVQQRPPSLDEEVGDMIDQTAVVGSRGESPADVYDDEIEYLVKEYGWKVRRMVESKSEMKKVADIQALAFHVPSLFLDDFFFFFFQAEVLSGLYYRLRNSPPDRYACLVAESAKEDNTSTKSQQLVGVVDVTVLRDNDVIQHLEGADEYLYVSGIAVSNNFRRQKVATVLLKACEVISVLWGYEYLVLRAYEDDMGARTLYTNAGYRLVSRDPLWVTLIGRKRRILMVKRVRLSLLHTSTE